MILGLTVGKTRRVCAALFAVLFLTLTVCVASLSPDKFFTELSPQNRVDGIIRAFEIIDGTSRAEDSCQSALRSMITRALTASGHRADIAFVSLADELSPASDFHLLPASLAGGAGTVARE